MKKALEELGSSVKSHGHPKSNFEEEMEIHAQISFSSSLEAPTALPLVNPTKSHRARSPGCADHGRKGDRVTRRDLAHFY